MTPTSFLHWLSGCRGRADGCGCSAGNDADEGLSEAAAALLRVSKVELDAPTALVRVTCPPGTSFDAATALRLEVSDRMPFDVFVDVQIAPAAPGALSPEDEAGVRLFGEMRAERLAPKPACRWPDPCACRVCVAPLDESPIVVTGALMPVEGARALVRMAAAELGVDPGPLLAEIDAAASTPVADEPEGGSS